MASRSISDSGPCLVNLRDVAARTTLPPDLLWRSDAPLAGDAAPRGLDGRRGDHPLTWPPPLVVDLREDDELDAGAHPLAGAGCRVVALPVASALAPDQLARALRGECTLAELYRQMLTGAPAWLPALVGAVARAEGPTLLHCAAGKDRTGIAVALLLSLAGVPRREIVADYLATSAALSSLHRRLRLERLGDVSAIEHLLDVSAPALEAVLDDVGADPADFHRGAGVDPADITAWRARARASRSHRRAEHRPASPPRDGHRP